ncbi:hypothetical protein I317_04512 [Kwoniella heveanensis CBS 569]|nr:hypothetical protein I317_04512 [Kwoniella heveanensis CBS 569]
MSALPHRQSPVAADVRLYNNRASYSLQAALEIFRQSPVAHVAFVHPGDAETGEEEDYTTTGTKDARVSHERVQGRRRGQTVMNVPMIVTVVYEGEGEDEDAQESYTVYLHSHKHSGLTEAILAGTHGVTVTTTKIDGIVYSPVAQDHSLNYRSATFHLHQGRVLSNDDQDLEEKRSALGAVVNTVTGYDRSSSIGRPDDANTKRTTVMAFKIAAVSCKQRLGGHSSGSEPATEVPPGKERDEFTGVVPCWTEFGQPIGYGIKKEQVETMSRRRNEEGKAFAFSSAWASDEAKIEGLGKRRSNSR